MEISGMENTMVAKQKAKVKEKVDIKTSFFTRVRKSIFKRLKVKAAEDEIDVQELAEAGMILILDRTAVEVKHILGSYRSGE